VEVLLLHARLADARACYQALCARGIGGQAVLRELANRLVGILMSVPDSTSPAASRVAWRKRK